MAPAPPGVLMPRPRFNQYLDGIVRREAKLRFADRMKNTLLSQPDWTALAMDIQKNRGDYLGKLRVTHFVRNFPYVFEFAHGEDRSKWLRFTGAAKKLMKAHQSFKERKQRSEAVESVTKLLMLAKNRRIPVLELAKMAKYFGFPADYETKIFYSNPTYFRPVETKRARCLELSQWYPELAVTARERWIAEAGIKNPYEFPVPVEVDGGKVDREEIKAYFDALQEAPFPSPYDDAVDVVPGSASERKRTLATYHEILSLTIEKRILLHTFHGLGEYLGLPEGHLEYFRSNEPIFYVSHAGSRPWVFLRESYDTGPRERHPLLVFKERFFAMCMCVKEEKFNQIHQRKGAAEYDTDDSDIELLGDEDNGPRRPVPLDDFDVDGWCMA
ncbi:hypothetical protein SELMODRAFT_428942 [Selaginella moellendorffii]|uniref:Uncharacterized protein RPD1L6-2 n=1 Tax=Selaginella moellendorffii TaxID=88036 RepID=D8T4I6_SELML|nr:protein WHAT'S THIS FACTOR 1 homolog [Selaginella moellendorffii]EFJ08363.1 hypothetical protein SELMODRAFT_428942 [Selaginella moellendorffii]|eukprot:XP_002990486.1 protein WHAT'S THIS FACTOR 1 homolog [Selaginella moellendorffii]